MSAPAVINRVLIAVDGSELDTLCLDTARRLFGETAQYLAVNVSETPAPRPVFVPVPYGYVYPYTEVGPYVAQGDTNAEERAESVARRAAEDAGLDNAEPMGEVGDPGELIVRSAVRHGCDVIVVGSHERGWLSRLVSPSVSNEVMDASTIPVLVVKSPE